MKKNIKNYMGLILLVTLIVGIAILSNMVQARALDDPFLEMCDSNTMFLEGVMHLKQDLVARTENNGQAYMDSQQLLKAVKDNRLTDLDISDTEREMIAQLYEDTLFDRYIVKYKDSGKTRKVQDVPGVSVVQVFEMSAELQKGRNLTPGTDRANTGGLEVIVLSEKTNPAEFATVIKAAGMAAEILYMQPDFVVEYAGVGLSYREIVDVKAAEPATGGFDDDGIYEVEEAAEEELPGENLLVEELIEEILQPKGSEKEEIIIALIDTGVDINHPAPSNAMVGGWNFINNNAIVYDSSSPMQSAHGTHLAGIINDNSDEYVKIMPLQVFGQYGGAYTSDIIAAIDYAEAHGAKIANCSFGSKNENRALKEAIESSGMLFVCAVGNSRCDLEEVPIYPASYGQELNNVISVGSLNSDNGYSYYSNYSSEVIDIAARGRDVLSTLPEGEYGLQSGTSMAAAYTSAGSALVLSENPDLSAADLKGRMCVTGKRLSNLQNKVIEGRSLDVVQALSGAPQNSIVQIDPADDFDVHGYQPTQGELYELFSSSGGIEQIAASFGNSIILKENGTVWASGLNASGQCGNGVSGTNAAEYTFVQVVGLNNIIAVAAGDSHSLALKADGSVWSWGFNGSGQLGDGTTVQRATPVQASGLAGIVNIAVGGDHSLAVKSDGSLWAWGSNTFGQLGNGTTTSSSIPVQISSISNVKKVSAGFYHSVALKTDGSVFAWGYNTYGQLGDGTTTQRTTPVQASGLTSVADINAWAYLSYAIKSDTTAWAWGFNGNGQFGNGNTNSSAIPIQISGLGGISNVSIGYGHTAVLKPDGTVWTFGQNEKGQLGNGTNGSFGIPVPAPAQISGLISVVSVATGGNHCLAIKSDGSLWAWGDNAYGQFGNGSATSSNVPVKIADGTGGSVTLPGQITINAVSGKQYDIALYASGITSFSGTEIIVSYNSAIFDIVYYCSFTKAATAGTIAEAGITVTQVSLGKIKITSNKSVPSGKQWAGAINVIRLQAKATAQSVVSVD